MVRGVFGVLGVRSELAIRHLHRAGNVRCRLPNGRVLRLWSRGDDWVSNQIYWNGLPGYEPETVPVFLRLAREARVIFDIGAYVGLYTVLAAHMNPAAEVYAFEPHPYAYDRLLRNVTLNRLSNVQCFRAAVGEADTSAQLYCGPGEMPTSSSLSADFMRRNGPLRGVPVTVVTIDEFVRKCGIGRVGLVKIDTESTEPQVLRGMIEILRRDRPFIIAEVLRDRGSEEPLSKILHPLGYRFYLLTPSGPQLVERIRGHSEWLNYLFSCS
jgi:FkbM family methyltransferase